MAFSAYMSIHAITTRIKQTAFLLNKIFFANTLDSVIHGHVTHYCHYAAVGKRVSELHCFLCSELRIKGHFPKYSFKNLINSCFNFKVAIAVGADTNTERFE